MKSIPSNGTLRHLLLLIVLLLNSVWEWKNVDNKIATAFVVGNKLIKPNAMYRWRNYGIHAGKSFNDVDIGDRVVVTGMGVISPCGNEVEAFFRWISHSGKSSVTRLNRFDTEPFKCKIAAQVENFYPKDYYIVKKRAKENDLSCHYAVAASHMALQMAGISIGGPAVDWNRVGVSIGSGFGGIGAYANALESMTEKGINGVSPYTIPMILGNFPAAMVSIEVGARGPSKAVQTACATATDAIGDALQLLRNGKADVMIAGGTEAPLTPLIFAGFQNLRTLSTSYNDEPNIASRPFDLKRDGFVMSEGAGVLVLERLTHAVRRNAKVYCELAGKYIYLNLTINKLNTRR
jgi:3-oxoacyl-[acyl-carrier-protein] synthase II